MSYCHRMNEAREDCEKADIQIDGHDASSTSPVMHGGSFAGMAPMSGEQTFSKSRTRPEFVGNRRTGFRREFPTEGVSSGSK
jgi:hypothetical protein